MVPFGWAESGHSFQKTLNGWRGRDPEPIRPVCLFLQPPRWSEMDMLAWGQGKILCNSLGCTQPALSPWGLSVESGSLPSPREPPRSEPQGSTAMTPSRMRGHCCPSLPCFSLPPRVSWEHFPSKPPTCKSLWQSNSWETQPKTWHLLLAPLAFRSFFASHGSYTRDTWKVKILSPAPTPIPDLWSALPSRWG